MSASPRFQRVSVIVPCRNERDHIEAFCQAVLAQRLPEGVALEVLIADGQSDDGTREWLRGICQRDARFVLIDNPQRIVSAGLNRCIECASGDLIVRWDVHTVYAPDYLAQCLAVHAETGADNVGGPWKAEGQGWVGRAIAAAFQSRWVVGGARSRDLAYEGPVDTVYLGSWPRATLARFGGFDETLVRNQDDEHNLRLTKGGARVWQSARIQSSYQPRGSIAQLFRQQRQYGYWKPFVMKKHGQSASIRHLVPGLFVAALFLLTLQAAVTAGLGVHLAWLPWAALVALYGGFVLTVSVLIAADAGWSLLPLLPVVIGAYHVGYGLGSIRGAFDVLSKGAPDPAFGRLTR